MARVLVAGESWMTHSVHVKGFDSFTTSVYVEGLDDFRSVVEADGHTVDHQPCHVAADHFPDTLEELRSYDVVVLSDIGANTLLLPARTFADAMIGANRLEVLREWVSGGGGLAMIGGYLSFTGIEGKANYRASALVGVLPVEMEPFDDREEVPQGVSFRLTDTAHPITEGLDREWPAVLGFQRFAAKPGTEVLASAGEYPALVVGTHGEGRVLAFATDIGPHWAPPDFVKWPGFRRLWDNAIRWLGGD
jgi:uncharacterized membrane protein